ncbi:1,4-dihydroxy-2-naphthoate octaprenyltransferase [Flavobacterium sp. 20NA77.7]|uniref:1,4-dihydroxy-2-naphthoate octaprenyltransferase n=1 Tax=Flavobacterium nakdongensis TaxID=3073563 RepID=A0ABY9RDF6_9FLAO|nr:1,4-dihydroxy-2-naphthoate octaprenyltransferase [Flavobacterium sp. 20NA77.7]WMW78660.1 1,4-dihydroxy-2-naphthoate octaprenyltransferase [Flavobacterium sp. 20NA77.7]
MKNWIQAARLRTLPLSISGIIVGSAYAYYQNQFDWKIFVLAVATTLSFQILSNFANDYGDGIKGTDENRIGEKRLVASGEVSALQMKKAVQIMGIVSFVFALVLIYISFGKANFLYSLVFLLLGIASIVAAIKYTVGKKAYGYSGLGDVFVFIFFGLVAVLGSNFLYTKTLDWRLTLPAVSIGLLATAVLNLNNMRDIENDKKAGKNTLVVKMGLKWAKTYQEVILASGMVCFMVFALLLNTSLTPVLIVNIPIIKHMGKVRKAEKYEDFEPELKKVALSTFALSILFWITIVFLN